MKLNFWQILGIILVVVALIFIIRREANETAPPAPTPAPTPAPATAATTTPG